jgi:hypothetical protein
LDDLFAITAHANTGRTLAWSTIYREWQSIEKVFGTSTQVKRHTRRLNPDTQNVHLTGESTTLFNFSK